MRRHQIEDRKERLPWLAVTPMGLVAILRPGCLDDPLCAGRVVIRLDVVAREIALGAKKGWEAEHLIRDRK